MSFNYRKILFQDYLNYIFPISYNEFPKFLSLSLLMFCILCIQNLIRAMKDSIINTMIGTETIAFLKFWGVLPAAFLITIIYVKLVNSIKGENVFYLIISIFLSFFAIFAFYLFPNHETIHLSKITSNNLVQSWPHFKWFILLISNWSFSLFYIISELWPNVAFALLYWQFVNNITSINESKRFYPLFGLLGQTGLFFSGEFLSNLSIINRFLISILELDRYNISVFTMQLVVSVVLILGFITLITFWFTNKLCAATDIPKSFKFKAKKTRISVYDSCKMVIRSRYIRLITILLICYGITINLVEGPWKAKAAEFYTNPTDYAIFIGNYQFYTGILTIFFVIIGSNIVRKFGWLYAAIITPIILMASGLMFFVTSNFNSVATFFAISFAITNPLLIIIVIGAIQNILSKSTKYTLFDSTKEMAYVPLDDHLKTEGKAAADIIGTKLGKSLGALLQSLIFFMIPSATYASISPFLMVVFVVISAIWIWGVIELNKEYRVACKTNS